jgi:hypothetical protein
MHYWNRGNFEGLLQLAAELAADHNLRPLSDYCRHREKGLRREAFAALEHFLVASGSFDNAAARAAAVKILELNARTGEAHQFLTQPLVTRFLTPTLKAWMDDEPCASTPIRWLGLMSRDNGLLERALSISPDDTPVRKRLIESDLSHADYATHHLDESCFLGNVEEVIAALAHARDLIADAPEPEALAQLLSEVHYFDHQVADWKAYSKNPVGSFPEWCAKQGRKYSYPAKYYYER